MHCPLCTSINTQFFHRDNRRSYNRCLTCDLVFVESQFLPSIEAERSEYNLHQNLDDDQGYLTFLDRARLPILEKCQPNSLGLDYGCGPNPVLAKRLAADGFQMSFYDPLFYPHLDKGPFDFIVSTEAIEHFHNPKKEWQRWMELLNQDGSLFIMTKRWLSLEKFKSWHYKNDQTHVSFFHENTFRYLAENYNLHTEFVGNDVVVMHR
jgi:SAM-dependent methyltransferase